MIDSEKLEVHAPATDADGNLLLSADEARDLLRECFDVLKNSLRSLVRMSIETTNDLFEMNEYVSEADAQDFRLKRDEWTARFERALGELFEKRLSGVRRQGRRPDFDASLTTLRVLNAFDQEKQAALTEGASMLERVTRRELNALDVRVGVLLREKLFRDLDNPLSPDYILDAIGVASRAVYPNPRIWRPLMERVITDITPGMNKTFIGVNRFLANRQVLPEIKAELRARSELRPSDDSELLPMFTQLFKEAAPSGADALLALNINVPAASASTNATLPPAAAPPARAAPPAMPGAHSAASSSALPQVAAPATVTADARAPAAGQAGWNPYLVDIAQPHAPPVTAPTTGLGLPQLDPMLALGTLSAAIAALDRWQRSDPAIEWKPSEEQAAADDAPAVPLNRIPFIRAAIGDKVINSTDKITMDVIGLLFDYIFRDASIPESLRGLFTRLQVPILKTALLDRTFFSDKKHPARRLLDHLAAASIGATGDAGYGAQFELIATGVIDEVCRDFKVDVTVFDGADTKLREFVDGEQRKLAASLDTEVAGVFAAEEGDADRSHVRAFIRDKLSGVNVPFDVRSFSETTWADYLTLVRAQHGTDSDDWRVAAQTLDDLLWSITSKERTAQKARLAKLVPGLIRSVRAGASALQISDDRMRPFLDVMYKLHMAAIKPKAETPAPKSVTEIGSSTMVASIAEASAAQPPIGEMDVNMADMGDSSIINIHDFVSEMVVGTWLCFEHGDQSANARLSWISPLRSKYIFTSRARTKAVVVTPEELAWQLGAGKARLVVEPVPLFDRAVSAALDSIAARKPPQGAAAAA
jgi:hypothetical protein